MEQPQRFHPELYKKVLWLERALVIICGLMQAIALFAPPDKTAPSLKFASYALVAVFGLSFVTPVRGSYWDRLSYLILELMVITSATAAGLTRFLFPLFVIVIAKCCILLDKRGLAIMSALCLLANMACAGLKIVLAHNIQLSHLKSGLSPSLALLVGGGSLVFCYVPIVLMVLVVMVTLALMAEQRSRMETERLSQEVQSLATELERTRIAREIHDSLGHTLTSLNIQLDVARKLQTKEPDRSSAALENAKQLASQSLTDVRLAIQSIREDNDFNFKEAVSGLVHEVAQRQHNIKFNLDSAVTDVPPSIGFQLYRVIQECLTNVLKHADASEVSININQQPGRLELSVADNGRGLSVDKSGANGFGIRGMQERVQSLNGTVSIDAANNQGTSITVHIPLETANTAN